MLSMTSVVKAANFILSRPTLSKIVTPIANKFTAYAGYREMGLKYVPSLALLSQRNQY